MSLPTANEQYMLDLINAERSAAGLRPLVFDDNLQTSSEGHSQWMIASDSFSHQGVNGSTPTQRMESAGYDFSGTWSSGENIAWVSRRAPEGDLDEVRLMHENLMNSPAHRDNILNPAFEEIGIGIEMGNMQGWDAAVVTQNFGLSSAPSTPPGGSVTPDVQAHADQVHRLYDLFNREPDQQGLNSWTKALSEGASLTSLAGGFLFSGEFTTRFGAVGSLSNEAYVNVLYENVLERSADAGGFAGWVNSLNQRASREAVLIGFTESPENQAQIAPLLASGILMSASLLG
jgi:hypothetical protein